MNKLLELSLDQLESFLSNTNISVLSNDIVLTRNERILLSYNIKHIEVVNKSVDFDKFIVNPINTFINKIRHHFLSNVDKRKSVT